MDKTFILLEINKLKTIISNLEAEKLKLQNLEKKYLQEFNNIRTAYDLLKNTPVDEKILKEIHAVSNKVCENSRNNERQYQQIQQDIIKHNKILAVFNIAAKHTDYTLV